MKYHQPPEILTFAMVTINSAVLSAIELKRRMIVTDEPSEREARSEILARIDMDDL